MSAQFFSTPIGYSCSNLCEVRVDGAVVFISIANPSASHATPEQAKQLGRALIKAGKFAEKKTTSTTAP